MFLFLSIKILVFISQLTPKKRKDIYSWINSFGNISPTLADKSHFVFFLFLKTPDKYSSEKVTKNTKVLIFLSLGGIDILEHKTKVCFHLLWIIISNDHLWTASSLLSSVSAVPVSSVHRLLLRGSSIFAQSLRLCGQTSCFGHLPLLPVSEQGLCE